MPLEEAKPDDKIYLDNNMKKLDGIEAEIKKSLEQIVEEYHSEWSMERDKSKWWTIKIKNNLCQLGHKRKYIVNANRCEGADDKIEWLFDMVWWNSKKRFDEIILAMECEWSLSEEEIWWDFEKLLVVRSKYRVFIFNQSNNDKVKNMIEQFKERIMNFGNTQPGDRYLLAGYSPYKEGFVFEHIVVP